MKHFRTMFVAFFLTLSMSIPVFAYPITNSFPINFFPSSDSSILQERVNVDREVTKTYSFSVGGSNMSIKFYGVCNSAERYASIYDYEVVSNPYNISYSVDGNEDSAWLVDLEHNGQHRAYIIGLNYNGHWSKTEY